MPIRVSVNGKVVEFPDGTTEDVMRKALSSLQEWKPEAPSAAEMLQHSGRMAPPDDSPEPDTWVGGFIKGLRKEFVDPLVSSPLAKSAARPETATDVAGLLLPSAIGMGSAKEFIPAAKNLYEGAAEGAANKEGLKKIPAVIKGMYDRAFNSRAGGSVRSRDLNIADAERKWYSEGHVAPDTTSIPDNGIPTGDLPAGNHVEVESALDAATRQSTRPSTGAQPEHVPYGGVEVPHKVKKPRMASEVANPYGKDDAVYEEMLKRMGKEPLPDEAMAHPMGPGPHVEDAGADVSKLGSDDISPLEGPESSVPGSKPKLSAEEVAAAGRRLYGSRDAGRMLYGDSLSPAERAEAIKRLSPGPSRVPLTAEARIRDAMNAAKGDDDPILKMLMAGLSGKMLMGHSLSDEE